MKGRKGVTQGNPLSPTIFNVVVDAVVHHWVTIVVTEAETREELGREGRHQAALFYADNGMLRPPVATVGVHTARWTV